MKLKILPFISFGYYVFHSERAFYLGRLLITLAK